MREILMNNEDFVNYSRYISAILPEYDKNGNNICNIIYENGEIEIIIMTLEKFLTHWAYSFNMLLASQRMWARTELHIKNRVPLVMNEDIVLFPIKTRKTVGPKDGCCGYINKINQAKQLKLTYKHQFMIQQKIYNNPLYEKSYKDAIGNI